MAGLLRFYESQVPRWAALGQQCLDVLWQTPRFLDLRAHYVGSIAPLGVREATLAVAGLFNIELGQVGDAVRVRREKISFPDEQSRAEAVTLADDILALAKLVAEPLGIAYDQPFAVLLVGQALLCAQELRRAPTRPVPGPGEVYLFALPTYRAGRTGIVNIPDAPAWTEDDLRFVRRQARIRAPSRRLPYGAVHREPSKADTVGPLVDQLRATGRTWRQIEADADVQAAYGSPASQDTLRRLWRRWSRGTPPQT